MKSQKEHEGKCSAAADGESKPAGGATRASWRSNTEADEAIETLRMLHTALQSNSNRTDGSCNEELLSSTQAPPQKEEAQSTTALKSTPNWRNPPLRWTKKELRLVSIFRQGMINRNRKKRPPKPKDAPKRPLW